MRTAAIAAALAFLAYWSTLQAPLSGDATTHLYLEAQWQWVFARLILDPPPAIAIEALVLGGCVAVYAVLARRSDLPAPGVGADPR